MKPQHSVGRPKDAIPFMNFAQVARIGGPVKLADHMFPFEGNVLDSKEFIWGVYGTVSGNRALFLADAHAQKAGKQMMVIQGWYRLDHFEIVRTQIDAEMARKTGFLHLERASKEFREELKAFVMKKAARKYPGLASSDLYRDKPIGDLILSYPSLVTEIFKYDENINMVVIPVRQVYDPVERRTITLAVMRRNADRLMGCEIRYRPDIEVLA